MHTAVKMSTFPQAVFRLLWLTVTELFEKSCKICIQYDKSIQSKHRTATIINAFQCK